MTQCERILRHINDYGSITSLEAVNEYGILHLAARVSDLRRLGHPIVSETVSGKNRYEEPVHYSRYFMARRE